MLYVIIGHDAPDATDKRRAVRPAHLEHLAPLAGAGRIKLAGKLLDRTGSLIVLEADSLADAWAIVARDPYVTEGIFNHVEVKPFQQVLPRVCHAGGLVVPSPHGAACGRRPRACGAAVPPPRGVG